MNVAVGNPLRWLQRGVVVVLMALVVGGMLLRARLLTALNINWDEFYFLSRVHTFLRGELSDRLLTFHVHLFGWVPLTSSKEVEQVFAMRAVMFGFGTATVVAIVWLGRRLLGSVTAGLFAAVACLSFSLVLQFGTSARFDPPIVAAFVVAAALIVSERRRLLPVAGALVAVGFLISIKSALYLPTLATLFVARRLAGTPWRVLLRDALVFSVSVVVVVAVLGGFHVAALATPAGATPAADAASGAGALVAIGTKVTNTPHLFPQKETLLRSLRWDRAFWGYLAIGVVVSIVGLRRAGVDRARAVMVLGFALPLVALTFYRNAFPYFYVAIIPPASLLTGAMVARLEQALRPRAVGWGASVGPAVLAAVTAVATLALALPLVWTGWRFFSANEQDEVQETQCVVLDVVHRIFPAPVPYIDRCGMVVSFPKVGPFMSTWTLEDYRQRGIPIMADLLAREQPRFVLANIPSLDLSRPILDQGADRHVLLPADAAVLRDNFVPYWGPVQVAGKRITLDDDHPSVTTPWAIGGRYVVEAAVPVGIDGVTRAAGDVVDLQPGHHTIAAVDGTPPGTVTTVVLRTAEARPPPDVVAPTKDLFRKFAYRRRPPRRP